MVRLLADWFDWLLVQVLEGPLVVPARHWPLIGALLEESMTASSEADIISILVPSIMPELRSVTLQFQLEDELLGLPTFLHRIGEQVFYGPPDAHSARNKNACMVWEVNNMALIPVGLSKLVSSRRAGRVLAAEQLAIEYAQLTGVSTEPLLVKPEPAPVAVMSLLATPKKPRGRPSVAKDTTTPLPGQAQLSSFFTVIKKTAAERPAAVELFQPFHVYEHCHLAPINAFADYLVMAEEEDSQMAATQSLGSEDFWTEFRHHAKKSAVAWQGKKLASCLAWRDGSMYFPAKLLQFHENYRPAYFGSMEKMKRSRVVSGRRPFAKEEGLDYEVDSDDDWCEELEVGDDAESIRSEDDDDDEDPDEEEEDEEEDGENQAMHSADEEDSWLDDGEAADMPTFKRQSYKKGQKRRYTQLQPIILGPHWGDQRVPEGLAVLCTRFLGDVQMIVTPLDPFAGSFIPSPPVLKPTPDAVPKVAFVEDQHLRPLAALVNGSGLGVAKLYDLFAAVHGRISKKQFELRINQIAVKNKVAGKGVWMVRPEYGHLLPTPEPVIPVAISSETDVLASQVADVMMVD